MPSKDTWDRSFEQLVELGAQIGIKIRERDENQSDPKLNSRVKKLLQDYQKRLQSLTGLLQQQSDDHAIPFEEVSRRELMLEDLRRKYNHLQTCSNSGWSAETRYDSTGYGGGGAMGGDVGGAMGTAENIRMHQRQIIKDQDEGLGELSKALRNQQRMGRDMQDEIQEHNVLIDEIHEHTSRTEGRVRYQTARVQQVRAKYSCQCSCVLWTTIVILAILIVVIGAVPF